MRYKVIVMTRNENTVYRDDYDYDDLEAAEERYLAEIARYSTADVSLWFKFGTEEEIELKRYVKGLGPKESFIRVKDGDDINVCKH